MSEELRPCPLCGAMPDKLRTGYMCSTLGCALQEHTVSEKEWNTRPIEDGLQAENERLKEELQHEKTRSQLNLEAEERRMLNITYYCAEIDRLHTRIAELEGLVDELIEAGAWGAELAINIGALSGDDQYKLAKKRYDKWDALVKDWEEREE